MSLLAPMNSKISLVVVEVVETIREFKIRILMLQIILHKLAISGNFMQNFKTFLYLSYTLS